MGHADKPAQVHSSDRGPGPVRTVLVIDDEPDQRRILRIFLERMGYRVLEAEDGEDGIQRMRDEGADLVVTDLSMPKVDGIGVLRASLETTPSPPVILTTAFGTVERAVEAMHLGAYDFLEKPWNAERLRFAVRRALERVGLQCEVGTLRSAIEARRWEREIVGDSGAIRQLRDRIRLLAPIDAPVVISGESGTGKELVARAIHELSHRAKGAFVAINCGALPENLLESELFGFTKGAFTGATAPRRGLIESAHGGTLFLDEIGDASPAIQQKLLRVIQEREVLRLGSTEPVKVDIRILAASNRDLKVLLQEQVVREDLYYRLAVVTLAVPPLRERPGDVPLLARWFLEIYSGESRKPLLGFEPEALAALSRYSWPGNVRELSNEIRRAAIFATGDRISLRDLTIAAPVPETAPPEEPAAASVPASGSLEADPGSYEDARRAFERRYLEALMKRHGGVIARAAKAAGRTRKDVYALLAKHGLDPRLFRTPAGKAERRE